MRESIRRVNGYGEDAYTYYPVLIVGAGASGIAMACRMKEELGFDQFRIFDRQAGIGGTWWINRYPGVACDVPAAFYSFSFAQNPKWSTFHPPGQEIVQYYHNVCEKYKITDKIQLNTDTEECRWLESEQIWEVTLRHLVAGVGDLSSKERMKLLEEHGETAVYSATEIVRARIVLSAVGGLVEPKGWPDNVSGLDKFKGTIFHSARWNSNVDLTDKNVTVIGTGCSAAQLVPRLTKAPYNAKSVTQLMRSPPWVVPRAQPPGGEEWWSKWSPTINTYIPGLLAALRLTIASGGEWDFRLFGGSAWHEKQRKQLEAKLIRHMKRTVPEKYHEMLTPDYSVGCKRRIFDAAWFPGLNDPKIELTTQRLTRLEEKSVILGPGSYYPSSKDTPVKEVPTDVIILSNGFDTTRWLHPLKVVGKGGKDLVDTMDERGGPQAYQGTAMDGFPNFFMIFGPNTATGHSSVVMASENMVNYSLKFIKLVLDGEASTVDVKQEAEERYTKEIQKSLKNTVFMKGGCQSWYFTKDGWNSTVYPYTQIDFARRCMFPMWNDWNVTYTRKGSALKLFRRAAKVLTITLLIVASYRLRQRGLGIEDLKKATRQAVLNIADGSRQVFIALKSIVFDQ